MNTPSPRLYSPTKPPPWRITSRSGEFAQMMEMSPSVTSIMEQPRPMLCATSVNWRCMGFWCSLELPPPRPPLGAAAAAAAAGALPLLRPAASAAPAAEPGAPGGVGGSVLPTMELRTCLRIRGLLIDDDAPPPSAAASSGDVAPGVSAEPGVGSGREPGAAASSATLTKFAGKMPTLPWLLPRHHPASSTKPSMMSPAVRVHSSASAPA